MQIKIRKIDGPAEPGVYAFGSVEVFNGSHCLLINDLMIQRADIDDRLGVSFPDPQIAPHNGGGPMFELAPELRQEIANTFLDAYGELRDRDKDMAEPQRAVPRRSGLVLSDKHSMGTAYEENERCLNDSTA
jgi:hypothetical protein